MYKYAFYFVDLARQRVISWYEVLRFCTGPYVPQAQPLPPVVNAAPAAPPPSPEVLLEFTMQAAQSLHSGQLNSVLEDVIRRARAALAAENPSQELRNGCLRWAVLLSHTQRGLDFMTDVINGGADVNHTDEYGNSCMALAIHFCKHNAVVKLLASYAHLKTIGNGIQPVAFARHCFEESQRQLPTNATFAFEVGHRKILEAITNHVLLYGKEAKPVAAA